MLPPPPVPPGPGEAGSPAPLRLAEPAGATTGLCCRPGALPALVRQGERHDGTVSLLWSALLTPAGGGRDRVTLRQHTGRSLNATLLAPLEHDRRANRYGIGVDLISPDSKLEICLT